MDPDHGTGECLQTDGQTLLENSTRDIQTRVNAGINNISVAITRPDALQGDGLAVFGPDADVGVGNHQRIKQNTIGVGDIDPVRPLRPDRLLQHRAPVGVRGVARHPYRIVAGAGILQAHRDRTGFLVGAGIDPNPVARFQVEAVKGQFHGTQGRIGRGHPVVRARRGGDIDGIVGVRRADVDVQGTVPDGKEVGGLGPDVGVFQADHAPGTRRRIGQAGHGPVGQAIGGGQARRHGRPPRFAAIHGNFHFDGLGREAAPGRPAQRHGPVRDRSRIAKRDRLQPRIIRRHAGLRGSAVPADIHPPAVRCRLIPHGRGRIAGIQQGRGQGIRRAGTVRLQAAEGLFRLQVIIKTLRIRELGIPGNAVQVLARERLPGRQIVRHEAGRAVHPHPHQGSRMEVVVIQGAPRQRSTGIQHCIGHGGGQDTVLQHQPDLRSEKYGIVGILPENAVADRDIRGLVEIDPDTAAMHHAVHQRDILRVVLQVERPVEATPGLDAVQGDAR